MSEKRPPEQQQEDEADDQPMPDAETTHLKILPRQFDLGVF